MIDTRTIFEIPQTGQTQATHLAEVVAVNDPDNRTRVQIKLLNFDGVSSQDGPVWARVAVPFAGSDRGAFFLPDVGDEVLVTFLNGDPRFPIVIGGLWNGNAQAPETLGGAGDRVDRWTIKGKAGARIAIIRGKFGRGKDPIRNARRRHRRTDGCERREGGGEVGRNHHHDRYAGSDGGHAVESKSAGEPGGSDGRHGEGGRGDVDIFRRGEVRCAAGDHGNRNDVHTGSGERMVNDRPVLRGALLSGAGLKPVIVQRDDQDFVEATLRELTLENRTETVQAKRAVELGDDKILRLYQPVHRLFHLALLEIVCDRPGFPRLDPQKIDSMGLVIRRIFPDR